MEHLTIMPVVSADGKAWPPIVVLPGVMNKFRKRADGIIETLHDYHPAGTSVAHRTPASMDSTIFLALVVRLIEHTQEIRHRHKNIILTTETFGAHMAYAVLTSLSENNIIAYTFPANTSHRTQDLEYCSFSPQEEYLRSQWSIRLISTQGERINYCITFANSYTYLIQKL